MSHTLSMEAKVSNKEALITALKRMGVPENLIEVHETPVRLRTYHPEENKHAHIIVRRNLAERFSGRTSDIGWEQTDEGLFVAHIDEYDYTGTPCYNRNWQNRLYTYCLVETAKKECELKGYTPVESLDSTGRIVVSAIAKKFEAPKSKYAIQIKSATSK